MKIAVALGSAVVPVFLLLAVPGTASANDYTWTGSPGCGGSGCSGSWADSQNWSPMGVPGSGDTATIGAVGGSDIYVSGAAGSGLAGLTVSPGGHVTDGAIDVSSGTFTWSGGGFGGGGPMTVTLDAGVTSTLTGMVELGGGEIDNAGTFAFVSGELHGDSEGIFRNSGTFTVTTGATTFRYGGGLNTCDFYNTGNLVVVGSGLTNNPDGMWGFHNSGTVNFTGGGTLEWRQASDTEHSLDDGGQITGTGTLLFDEPGFVYGSSSPSSVVSVSGTTTVASGATLAFDHGADVYGDAGGTLSGPGTLEWRGGAFRVGMPTAPWTWTSNLVVHMTGSDVKNMASGTIDSQATITWDAGDFGATDYADFINEGTFTATGDLTMNYSPDGGLTVAALDNRGTFTKSGGTGTLTVNDWAVHNYGTLTGASGTIELQPSSSLGPHVLEAGSTIGGSVRAVSEVSLMGSSGVAAGGTLELGTNTTIMSAATLDGTGTLTGPGTVQIDGAAVNADSMRSITFAADGNVSFTANPTTTTLSATDGSLTFAGTTTWTGGTIEIESGTAVNSGTWTAQTASTLDYNGGGARFDNTGTFNADPGASNTLDLAVGTINEGMLVIESGTTHIGPWGFTQTAGTTMLAGGNVSTSNGAMPPSFTSFDIQGGTLSGSGTIDGDVTSEGTVAPGSTSAAGTLTITQTYTQSDTGTFEVGLGGTNAGTDFDVLAVEGDVTLAGTLTVSRIGGYVPSVGDSYKVLTSGGADDVAGTFATVNQPDGVTLTTSYDPMDVTLGVTAVSIPADAGMPMGDAGVSMGDGGMPTGDGGMPTGDGGVGSGSGGGGGCSSCGVVGAGAPVHAPGALALLGVAIRNLVASPAPRLNHDGTGPDALTPRRLLRRTHPARPHT